MSFRRASHRALSLQSSLFVSLIFAATAGCSEDAAEEAPGDRVGGGTLGANPPANGGGGGMGGGDPLTSSGGARAIPDPERPTECPGDAGDAYASPVPAVPGTIEGEDFDPSGYSDSSVENEGGAYRADVEVDIKEAGSGYALGWMTSGEWLEYTVNVEIAGKYEFAFTVGAVEAGRSLQLSQCGEPLGAPALVPQVSDWGQFQSTTVSEVFLGQGVQTIRVTVSGADYLDFDAMTATLVEAGAAPSTADGTGGGTGRPVAVGDFVEDDSAGCPEPTLPDANSLPSEEQLPDPFTNLDGSRVASGSDWRCRRAEIKAQAERYVYGEKPEPPQEVSGTVSDSAISVNVSDQGQSATFSVSVQLPSTGSAPYPVLISYGSGLLGFSQSDYVRQQGVAIVGLNPYDVGAEQNGASRQNKLGAFYDVYGSSSSTGLLVAWAWGVSRLIDVLVNSDQSLLDPNAVAVAGCSRFGKGAFAAGVFDQRVALTIPFESGSGGVPIYRGLSGEGAQSASSAYGEVHWLGDAFSAFANEPSRLPFDTHTLVGMIAPRGLLILDNPHIANLGPQSAHVAALGGAEIYSALGAADAISYHSAVSSGSHCEARPEHQEPLRQAIERFLFKTGNAAGSLDAAANATGSLDAWRTWSTPTLGE